VRTLKLTLAYDGTPFVGWQRQAHGVSIQGLVEDALARFDGAPVTVHGAGRTDAGVHALGQVASAQIKASHPPDVIARALNASLPPEVRVTSVEDAADEFHDRFSARAKTYRYVIRNWPIASPFERAYVWQVPEPLRLEDMKTAAACLCGTHDFAAFRSTGSDVVTTTRSILRSEITVVPAAFVPFDLGTPGTLLMYEVEGDGFLRHMVRAIIGTLVEVGRGARTHAGVASLLRPGATRAEAGMTAPAHGLCLLRVDYD
jgi:tRNA pseudouridine38-40 synthase